MRHFISLLATVALTCAANAQVGSAGRPDSSIIQTIVEHYSTYDVYATTRVNGQTDVAIRSTDGTLSFESHFPILHGDATFLDWRYVGAVDVSASIRMSSQPTIEGMTLAGKDIVRLILRGRRPSVQELAAAKASQNQDPHVKSLSLGHALAFRPRAMDNYGCDWPFDSWISCSPSGNCCDTHDDCYAANNCNALSWLGFASLDCINCNVVVQDCLEKGIDNTGQPSTCCAAGNCGQPRPSSTSNNNGGVDNQYVAPDGSSGGSPWGGSTFNTPWGSVIYTNGHCIFPDGSDVPC